MCISYSREYSAFIRGIHTKCSWDSHLSLWPSLILAGTGPGTANTKHPPPPPKHWLWKGNIHHWSSVCCFDTIVFVLSALHTSLLYLWFSLRFLPFFSLGWCLYCIFGHIISIYCNSLMLAKSLCPSVSVISGDHVICFGPSGRTIGKCVCLSSWLCGYKSPRGGNDE